MLTALSKPSRHAGLASTLIRGEHVNAFYPNVSYFSHALYSDRWVAYGRSGFTYTSSLPFLRQEIPNSRLVCAYIYALVLRYLSRKNARIDELYLTRALSRENFRAPGNITNIRVANSLDGGRAIRD